MTEPGSTLVVRTAVRADAPSVAAIGRVAFPAVHNDVVGPEFAAAVVEQAYSIEALTECITRYAAATDAEFLVAEQDGDVTGYLHYDSEGPEPELHRIYVDPGQKRGGVGRALMRQSRSPAAPVGSTSFSSQRRTGTRRPSTSVTDWLSSARLRAAATSQ